MCIDKNAGDLANTTVSVGKIAFLCQNAWN